MVANLSALLALVYHFYPRGMRDIHRMHVPSNEPVYDDTVEHQHLVEAAKRGRANYEIWKNMIDRLERQYSVQNESISLLAGWVHPAYSARIWITQDVALTFHVSFLGPYYGIHLPGMYEEQVVASDVAQEIETTFPGYKQIPAEIGNAAVPDVYAGVAFTKETIYTCLFSEVWTWVEPAKP